MYQERQEGTSASNLERLAWPWYFYHHICPWSLRHDRAITSTSLILVPLTAPSASPSSEWLRWMPLPLAKGFVLSQLPPMFHQWPYTSLIETSAFLKNHPHKQWFYPAFWNITKLVFPYWLKDVAKQCSIHLLKEIGLQPCSYLHRACLTT